MGRAEQVLAGLASLQKDGILCDVTLQAEGQQLSAHRTILAASSPYFHAMFCGGFQETKQSNVPMQKVSFAGLKAVVDCIYTTKLKLNDENISDIVQTAHLLQMEDENLQIVNECRDWMNENIGKDNCFTLLTLADKFSFIEVQSQVHDYVMKNFVSVKETRQFKEISQDALQKILMSDTLRTGLNEMQVFDAAKMWIKHNDVVDKTVISDIMKNVRFGLLAQDEISEMFFEEIMAENKECRNMVKEANNYLGNVNAQPLCDGIMNRPRGKSGVLLIQQGKHIQGDVVGFEVNLHFLNYPNFEECKKRSLKTSVMGETIRAIQVNNFVFVFGTYAHGRQNFTKRYDATSDAWVELRGMPCDPVHFSTIAYNDGMIFSIGGIFDKRGSKVSVSNRRQDASNQVHAYSICSNDWKVCDTLPVKASGSAACSQGGLIFVSGGMLSNHQKSNQMYAYDLNGNLWLTKKSMRHAYFKHLMATVDSDIYVVGGALDTVSHDDDAFVNDDAFVEKYSILTDQWTGIETSTELYSITGGFVANNTIYIIGGTSEDWGSERNGIFTIEPEKDMLDVTDKSVSVRFGKVISFLVTLPKLL